MADLRRTRQRNYTRDTNVCMC